TRGSQPAVPARAAMATVNATRSTTGGRYDVGRRERAGPTSTSDRRSLVFSQGASASLFRATERAEPASSDGDVATAAPHEDRAGCDRAETDERELDDVGAGEGQRARRLRGEHRGGAPGDLRREHLRCAAVLVAGIFGVSDAGP